MAPVANAEEPRSGVAAVVAAAPRVSVNFVRLPTGVHLVEIKCVGIAPLPHFPFCTLHIFRECLSAIYSLLSNIVYEEK
jgi:hypothetical protein